MADLRFSACAYAYSSPVSLDISISTRRTNIFCSARACAYECVVRVLAAVCLCLCLCCGGPYYHYAYAYAYACVYVIVKTRF